MLGEPRVGWNVGPGNPNRSPVAPQVSHELLAAFDNLVGKRTNTALTCSFLLRHAPDIANAVARVVVGVVHRLALLRRHHLPFHHEHGAGPERGEARLVLQGHLSSPGVIDRAIRVTQVEPAVIRLEHALEPGMIGGGAVQPRGTAADGRATRYDGRDARAHGGDHTDGRGQLVRRLWTGSLWLA